MNNARIAARQRTKPRRWLRPPNPYSNPRPHQPTLRFSPTAWAKLLFLQDLGPTEVGGFGISAADDCLRIEDVQLVRQSCTSVTVHFDDIAVADFFDSQVDQGLQPSRFGRVWIHTHPGSSATPSLRDEETFACSFGSVDWAVMFILAQEGQTYARLRFNIGPGGSLEIPVAVDFSRDFSASNQADWKAEYERCVLPPQPRPLAIIDDWPADTVPRTNEFLDEEWADFFGWPDDERELAYRHEEFNPSEPFAEVVHV